MRVLLLFTTLIFSITLLGAAPVGYSKEVRTAIVCGHGVDCARAFEIFLIAQKEYLKTFSLRLKPVVVLSIPINASGDPFQRMDRWKAETKSVRENMRVGLTVVFIEPFPSSVDKIDFDVEQVFGMASDIGVLGNNDALAFTKMIGSNFVASRICIHEIGHIAGAWHTRSEGIMAQYANLNHFQVEFAPESIEQISHFLAGM